MYAANYDQYKRDMAAYKAGNKIDEEHDPAATQLQQDFAGAEPEVEAEADVEGEAEAEPAQARGLGLRDQELSRREPRSRGDGGEAHRASERGADDAERVRGRDLVPIGRCG